MFSKHQNMLVPRQALGMHIQLHAGLTSRLLPRKAAVQWVCHGLQHGRDTRRRPWGSAPVASISEDSDVVKVSQQAAS